MVETGQTAVLIETVETAVLVETVKTGEIEETAVLMKTMEIDEDNSMKMKTVETHKC